MRLLFYIPATTSRPLFLMSDDVAFDLAIVSTRGRDMTNWLDHNIRPDPDKIGLFVWEGTSLNEGKIRDLKPTEKRLIGTGDIFK